MLHGDTFTTTASTKSPPFSRLLSNVDRYPTSVSDSSNRKRKFIAQQQQQHHHMLEDTPAMTADRSSVFRGVQLVQHMSLRHSSAAPTGESDVDQWRCAILKEGYCVLVSQAVARLIPAIADKSYPGQRLRDISHHYEIAIDICYDPSNLQQVQQLVVDSGTAANESLEVAMCSVTAGTVSLITAVRDALNQTATAPNGLQVAASVITTKLPLAYEDERITCVCHAGTCPFLLLPHHHTTPHHVCDGTTA